MTWKICKVSGNYAYCHTSRTFKRGVKVDKFIDEFFPEWELPKHGPDDDMGGYLIMALLNAGWEPFAGGDNSTYFRKVE